MSASLEDIASQSYRELASMMANQQAESLTPGYLPVENRGDVTVSVAAFGSVGAPHGNSR
jgi:hypothetical protein